MLKNKKCQALLIAASAFIGINGNVYGSNLGKPYPTRIDGDGRVMKDPLAMVNRQAEYRGEVDRQMNLTDHLKKAQESLDQAMRKVHKFALKTNGTLKIKSGVPAADDSISILAETLFMLTGVVVADFDKQSIESIRKTLSDMTNITGTFHLKDESEMYLKSFCSEIISFASYFQERGNYFGTQTNKDDNIINNLPYKTLAEYITRYTFSCNEKNAMMIRSTFNILIDSTDLDLYLN